MEVRWSWFSVTTYVDPEDYEPTYDELLRLHLEANADAASRPAPVQLLSEEPG